MPCRSPQRSQVATGRPGDNPAAARSPTPASARHAGSEPAITTTAFVATYPPRACAVATYTYDLATASFPRQIVALQPPDGPATYPAEVQLRIRRDEPDDYALAAAALGASAADVVSLQYEPGIWGGEDGEHILLLLDALTLPAVTTLHSIPRHPTARQRRVLRAVADASAAVVVLSTAASSRLAGPYGIDAARVDVVPCGVPNLPFVDPETVKPRLGLAGRHVVLSFGLMDPGKGYETVIEAMRTVVDADPSALYVILGATRVDVLAADGEAYREELAAAVGRLGLADHVRFENRFLGRVELASWVEAADVVVAPCPDPDRVASGTLAFAMGAGRAIVAAPSAYAQERLSRGRGVLVPAGSADGFAAAILGLLGDPVRRVALGRRIYDDTRGETWFATGAAYGRIFSRVARPRPAPADRRRTAPVGA